MPSANLTSLTRRITHYLFLTILTIKIITIFLGVLDSFRFVALVNDSLEVTHDTLTLEECHSLQDDLNTQVVTFTPNPTTYQIIALRLIQHHCYDQAEYILRFAIDQGLINPFTLIQLADTLDNQGKHLEAATFWGKSEYAPFQALNLLEEITVTVGQKDYESAIQKLEQLIALDEASQEVKDNQVPYNTTWDKWYSRRWGLYYNMGLSILASEGDLSEAAKFFRLSLGERDSTYTRKLLARALIGTNRLNEARLELEEVLLEDKDDPLAHRLLGGIAANEENWTEARLHYELSLENSSVPPIETLYEYGRVLLDSGDSEKALEIWQSAYKLHPDHTYFFNYVPVELRHLFNAD